MAVSDGAAYEVREHYTKYEYRVPMRDGVRLFTSVLVPKDASTKYPIMLTRTPFGLSPYGPDEHSPLQQPDGGVPAGRLHPRPTGCSRPAHVGG